MYAQGNALHCLGQQHAAIFCYDAAIGWMPDYAPVYFNRGNVFEEIGNFPDAEKSFKAAISIDSQYLEAYNNLAVLYIKYKRFEDADKYLKIALKTAPENIEALVNLGLVHLELQEYESALQTLEKAVHLKPDNPDVHYNMSHCLLQMGQFGRAWEEYSWRWNSPKFTGNKLYTPHKRWDFATPVNKLLIWAEQGVGDEIFWSSLLHRFKQSNTDLTVQIDDRLVPLLSRSMTNITFKPKSKPISEDQYDAHIAMGDLGLALHRRDGKFSPDTRPFILPNRQHSERIRATLCPDGQWLCGLSWRSKNESVGNEKSMNLEHLLPLLQIPGVLFVNLQYGDVTAELSQLKAQHGIEVLQYKDIDAFKDLDGLTDLVAACNTVVTTSNTTAHLAGALGQDTLLLLPFGRARIWYWLNERQGHSLWYPSVRMLAQHSPGEGWERVSRDAASRLRERNSA
jgi:tetratricopeptide (TPR) repeat protein